MADHADVQSHASGATRDPKVRYRAPDETLATVNPRVSISRRIGMSFLIFILFFASAAASFSGAFAKWGFRDGLDYSIPNVSEGVAPRPFVYRRLLPDLATALDRQVPMKIREAYLAVEPKASPAFTYGRAKDARQNGYQLRYMLIYYMSFSAMLVAIFALSAALRWLGYSRVVTIMAPVAFALIYPYLMTGGFYFYDIPELAFFAMAFYFAVSQRWLLLMAMAPVATLNKEAFLLYLLTLTPFALSSEKRVKAILSLCFAVSLAAIINAYTKYSYAKNPGGMVDYQLIRNLTDYFHSSTYLLYEYTYGIASPKGMSFISIACVIALVLVSAPTTMPRVLRTHACVALIINIPLFLIFCGTGELRNLSMLFVLLTILIARAIESLARMDRGGLSGVSPAVKIQT